MSVELVYKNLPADSPYCVKHNVDGQTRHICCKTALWAGSPDIELQPVTCCSGDTAHEAFSLLTASCPIDVALHCPILPLTVSAASPKF